MHAVLDDYKNVWLENQSCLPETHTQSLRRCRRLHSACTHCSALARVTRPYSTLLQRPWSYSGH